MDGVTTTERDAGAEEPAVAGHARSRSPWIRVVTGAVVVLAGAAVLAGVGRWTGDAQARYAAASVAYDDAAAAYDDAVEEAAAARRHADDTGALAERFVAIDLAPAVDAGVADPLERAAAELDDLVSRTSPPADVEPVASVDSDWPPTLDEAATALTRSTRELEDRRRALEASSDRLDAAAGEVESAGHELLAEVAASPGRLEAANPSAHDEDLLAFRAAADAVDARVDRWDAESADLVASYVAAAAQLAASNAAGQAEQAARAGDLGALQQEVEAFARSIAGGVPLAFEWAPVVNGYGGADSYGGWATVPDGVVQATISLSDSVARDWAASGIPRAVVVHEVGHAMSSKCRDRFTPSTRAESEAWATAWAISMGYDGPGNGESLYGRPSDALVGLAATCR